MRLDSNIEWKSSNNTIVVSIEFSPLGIELTTNWYQLHNGENGYLSRLY